MIYELTSATIPWNCESERVFRQFIHGNDMVDALKRYVHYDLITDLVLRKPLPKNFELDGRTYKYFYVRQVYHGITAEFHYIIKRSKFVRIN